MIDVHSHYLPCVDDGSPSVETSVEMLKFAEKIGVTGVVLTPHYRGKYRAGKDRLFSEFDSFCKRCEKEGVSLSLYLGQEVYYEKGVFDDVKNAEYLTMCGGKYLLTELPFDVEVSVYDVALKIINQGYVPVFAHVERYSYLNSSYMEEVKELGAMIQINADSVAGALKKSYGKAAISYLKAGLVDFIASDVHFNRENKLDKAYAFVKKKFGEDAAQRIFVKNPQRIIKNV